MNSPTDRQLFNEEDTAVQRMARKLRESIVPTLTQTPSKSKMSTLTRVDSIRSLVAGPVQQLYC